MDSMFGNVLKNMLIDAVLKDNPNCRSLIAGKETTEFLRKIEAALSETGETKCPGITDPNCNYLSQCGKPCNKCGNIHKHVPQTNIKNHDKTPSSI